VALLTYGSPLDTSAATRAGFPSAPAYARARLRELSGALELLPNGPPEWFLLGFTDQEVAPRLIDAVAAVRGVVDTFRASVVITHPYEGGHPDHDAAAFAAQMALRALPHTGAPQLLEMTSYHWTGTALRSGEFLASAEPVATLELDDDLRAMKERMLRCFTSQRGIIDALQIPAHERFRRAPHYDFNVPPAAPDRIFYDRLHWRIDSTRWRQYVLEALRALDAAPSSGVSPV
jgi:LmbE family N-acetylglucosaminyl deacetylase